MFSASPFARFTLTLDSVQQSVIHAKQAGIDSGSEGSAQVEPLYAEVAVPLRVAQTFTYRLPLALRREARLGSRLLVTFGRKRITGYIVALHHS